jgi:hypothetical protein
VSCKLIRWLKSCQYRNSGVSCGVAVHRAGLCVVERVA